MITLANVKIPKKIANYIENAKTHYKCKHNILAYTLHSISFGNGNVNDKSKELPLKKVEIITKAVYNGYTTS